MYNASAIEECFAGLVGISQTVDPSIPLIPSELTSSSSGLYVDKIHPFCTVENLYKCAPMYANMEWAQYELSQTYVTNDIVIYLDKLYKADANIAANQALPGINIHWIAYEPFSVFVQKIFKQGASNLVSKMMREKKNANAAKSLLQDQQLYQGWGNLNDKIVKQSRFVGLAIDLISADGLMATISRFGLQVDTAQAELNIYLYHSAQRTPLAVFPMALTAAGDFTWKGLTEDNVLAAIGAYDPMGTYYIGYYEDDLTGQAIKKNYQFSYERPCMTCSTWDINSWNQWSKYVNIRSISVPASALQVDNTLFDTNAVQYAYNNSWGINLSLTVGCDVSGILCRNKMILADTLAQSIATECLKEIGYNLRLGFEADKTKHLALADINENDKSSFISTFNLAVSATNLDFSGLNSACLPCQTSGVKRRAI